MKFIKNQIRLLFIVFQIFILFTCCENQINQLPRDEVKKISILNGLYEVNYHNADFKSIWIISDNTIYTLYKPFTNRYVDKELGIGYESPIVFYIEGGSLYFCGIDIENVDMALIKCKKNNNNPSYEISRIDTLYDGFSTVQVVLLKEYDSRDSLELRKVFYDTITREINVKRPSLYDMIKALEAN